jgi:1-deoxyxylulose-5-phosphate synthase
MDHVRFGRTGLKVSRLCPGSMGFGSSAWKGWAPGGAYALAAARPKALEAGLQEISNPFFTPGRRA